MRLLVRKALGCEEPEWEGEKQESHKRVGDSVTGRGSSQFKGQEVRSLIPPIHEKPLTQIMPKQI